MYLAVVNVSDDKKQYMMAALNSEFQLQSQGVVNLAQLVQLSAKETPLNYSVENGKIKEDCGAFSRLKSKGIVLIVLCAVVPSGKAVARNYKVLNARTGMVQIVDKESLLRQQALQKDFPILQNGIIRGGTISAYPGKEFIRVEMQGISGHSKQHHGGKTAPTGADAGRRTVTPDFMKGQNFSKQQLETLKNAKKRGVPVELFAKDSIPQDVLEFYCDTMVDKNLIEDCKPMLNNPDLSKSQVEELYQCAMFGMDISELASGDKTPSEIEVERLSKGMDTWGNINYKAPLDSELYEKCMRMAEHTLK